MQIRFLISTLLLCLLYLCSSAALAWNDFGHMTVAYVAYKELNAATRKRADALLKLNPYYETWKKELPPGITEKQLAPQIFMLAATWPDLIKRDSSYVSDGSNDGNYPDGKDSSLNTGYSDHLMHKYWHFYDQPFSEDGTANLPPIPKPNAQTQIAACRKVLSSGASDQLKSYDLSWLMHMVGDIHQPMHCATRVSKFTVSGDNGGNDVLVNFDDKLRYRLHGFWDNCLGSGLPADVMNFADRLVLQRNQLSHDTDASHWINESFAFARSTIYTSPIRWGNGPFFLTAAYRQRAVALSKNRVALAGLRLANLLNKELK